MLGILCIVGVVFAYLWLTFDGARLQNLSAAKRARFRKPRSKRPKRRTLPEQGDAKDKRKTRSRGLSGKKGSQLELFEEHTGQDEGGSGLREEECVSANGGTTFTPAS